MSTHNSIIIIFGIVALFIVAALARSAETSAPKDGLTLIRSDKAVDRTLGGRLILEERARVVQSLIDIIKLPRVKTADGWLAADTARNTAIECIGEYRAVEAISALVVLLEPAPGEHIITDSEFRLCPAAQSLVKIGRQSVPALIATLATTTNMSAMQARLALYDIEGGQGGAQLLQGAIAVEKEPSKRTNLQANLKEFQTEIQPQKVREQ